MFQNMQNPIGLLLCTDVNKKYNRIEIFRDSKIIFGLNEQGQFELQYDQIRQQIAILEHKFNSFLLQSNSYCCYHEGKLMEKDGIIILNENDRVRFQNCEQSWEYILVFVQSSKNKNKDSKLKRVSQEDNLLLENTLRCGICLDVFQRPVQLQCKHCFCGRCITQLLMFQKKCPTCRAEVQTLTNIQILDELCLSYLRKYPEKAKSLDLQQQYDQSDFTYELLRFQQPRGDRQQQVDEQLEQLQIDEIVPQNQQQIQQLPKLEQLPYCRSCLYEYKKFICQPNQLHVQCCNYLLPQRQLNVKENQKLKMFCQVCKKYTCKFYYKQDCQSLRIFSFQDWVYLINFFCQAFIPQVLINQIQQYIKGIPIDYIFSSVINNCVRYEQFYLEGQQNMRRSNQNKLLLSQSPICIECIKDVFPQMVIKFFELNRIPQIQGIPNCQYGIHCHLQNQNNDDHNNYNHLCRRQI